MFARTQKQHKFGGYVYENEKNSKNSVDMFTGTQKTAKIPLICLIVREKQQKCR